MPSFRKQTGSQSAANQVDSQQHTPLIIKILLLMILHSSSFKYKKHISFCVYFLRRSPLRLAIFACVHFARKRIIFKYNYWLSYQRRSRFMG